MKNKFLGNQFFGNAVEKIEYHPLEKLWKKENKKKDGFKKFLIKSIEATDDFLPILKYSTTFKTLGYTKDVDGLRQFALEMFQMACDKKWLTLQKLFEIVKSIKKSRGLQKIRTMLTDYLSLIYSNLTDIEKADVHDLFIILIS